MEGFSGRRNAAKDSRGPPNGLELTCVTIARTSAIDRAKKSTLVLRESLRRGKTMSQSSGRATCVRAERDARRSYRTAQSPSFRRQAPPDGAGAPPTTPCSSVSSHAARPPGRGEAASGSSADDGAKKSGSPQAAR